MLSEIYVSIEIHSLFNVQHNKYYSFVVRNSATINSNNEKELLLRIFGLLFPVGFRSRGHRYRNETEHSRRNIAENRHGRRVGGFALATIDRSTDATSTSSTSSSSASRALATLPGISFRACRFKLRLARKHTRGT